MSKILSIFTPAIGMMLRGNPLYSIVGRAIFPLRNGVITALSEGIAAQDAPQCENCADDDSPFLHGLYGIGGTGGAEPAASLGLEGRQKASVKLNGKQIQSLQGAVSPCDNNWMLFHESGVSAGCVSVSGLFSVRDSGVLWFF